MSMIDGFSISGYRSFGPEEVQIADLSRLNIFIGKNNCGKSNILRFLKRIGSAFKPSGAPPVPADRLDPLLDYCFNGGNKIVSFGIQIKKSGFTSNVYSDLHSELAKVSPSFGDRLGENLWFHYRLNQSGQFDPVLDDLVNFLRDRFKDHETNAITGVLCNYREGNPGQRYIDIAKTLHMKSRITPDVHLIDAFRKITPAGNNRLSGDGLIKELRKLQSPIFSNYQNSRDKFQKIGDFVRSVLGESAARLEIPAETEDVYVVIDDKTLPLESLGAGIHELVIMATAVTLIDDAVICIEEPEIHCHPALQKKFARYLIENTSNQYLIASHSNAFLDVSGANTYRCWLDEAGYTQCELASEASEKHAVLVDLGYKPSDLLQANCVIWVEGPSDRVYINHWLKSKAPDLLEGIQYAIMFYGGRLLSHLCYESAAAEEDPVVEDFVQLARMNRSACIVIDSDRKSLGDSLNSTKDRIIKEFNSRHCLVWVTEGRTIENYVPILLLNEAIAIVHARTKTTLVWEQFSDLTKLNENKSFDKVSIARRVAEKNANFSPLDLECSVDRLVHYIRERND